MTVARSRSTRARLAELSDTELVAIARRQLPHVTTAYEALMRRYQERLIRTCNRYLGSLEDAQEAVHESMLRVFHGLDKFKGDASFKTWLFRIAHNEAMNVLRKRKDHASLDELGEELHASDPDRVEQQVMAQRVDKVLSQLNQEDRTVIVFRTVAELEFQEIADILEQNLSTVKMRYQRAIEKLRQLMTQ